MLHTSARALCALQIPNIAWALNASQMFLWLLVMCCAINRKRAKALPSKCVAKTKWLQTPGTPMLPTERRACCNQPSSNASKPAAKSSSPQAPRALQTPGSAAAPGTGTPRVTHLPRVCSSNLASRLGLKAALPAGHRPHGSPAPGCVGSCLSLGERQPCKGGQWCGACRCAQGLLFHFHLSHPISTAVCHQRREN